MRMSSSHNVTKSVELLFTLKDSGHHIDHTSFRMKGTVAVFGLTKL
jgi:hypothetical protein